MRLKKIGCSACYGKQTISSMDGLVANNKSAISDDHIATMEPYTRGHNPVEEFAFEINREVPQTKTIYDRIDLQWVRDRVRENPVVTLSELSQLIGKQLGVAPSVSHVLRIQQLAGIARVPGS